MYARWADEIKVCRGEVDPPTEVSWRRLRVDGAGSRAFDDAKVALRAGAECAKCSLVYGIRSGEICCSLDSHKTRCNRGLFLVPAYQLLSATRDVGYYPRSIEDSDGSLFGPTLVRPQRDAKGVGIRRVFAPEVRPLQGLKSLRENSDCRRSPAGTSVS
jgi:hypothetical protein